VSPLDCPSLLPGWQCFAMLISLLVMPTACKGEKKQSAPDAQSASGSLANPVERTSLADWVPSPNGAPLRSLGEDSFALAADSASVAPRHSADRGPSIHELAANGMVDDAPVVARKLRWSCGGRVASTGPARDSYANENICAPSSRRPQGNLPDPPLEVWVDVFVTKRTLPDGSRRPLYTRSRIDSDVARANQNFKAFGIQFAVRRYAEVDQPDSVIDYALTGAEPYGIDAGAIGVYYVSAIPNGGGGGVAPSSGANEWVYVTGTSYSGWDILSHELGHTFGLQHTYWCSATTDGDNVLDTPFDPTFERHQCVDGVDTVVPGESCSPQQVTGCKWSLKCTPDLTNSTDVLNMMTHYSPTGCRQHFSPGQAEVMACTLRGRSRGRIKCDSPKTLACDPVLCVDTRSDRKHCGAACKACPAGGGCRDGVCWSPCDDLEQQVNFSRAQIAQRSQLMEVLPPRVKIQRQQELKQLRLAQEKLVEKLRACTILSGAH
jgi:hypothetical protein